MPCNRRCTVTDPNLARPRLEGEVGVGTVAPGGRHGSWFVIRRPSKGQLGLPDGWEPCAQSVDYRDQGSGNEFLSGSKWTPGEAFVADLP